MRGSSNGGVHHWYASTQGTDHDPDLLPDFAIPSVKHKAELVPIFLAYKRVSVDGTKIPLIHVATSIVQALQDDSVIDAVQPMPNGWCIYLRTNADRLHLIETGLTLAGKYISLCSESHQSPRKSTVKLMLKDLPLHTVSNTDMLENLQDFCKVQSEVNYSNVWHNGQHQEW